MKQILFIARDDLRQIGSSVMAKIFVVILIAVPLFFTWFNVLATWEPFDNSDQLKIAVASTDVGYRSDVLDMQLNAGDLVLKDLATNDQLDWVITSEDRALEGARSGEYYAAIVLPPDFSQSMFTFYMGGASPANITLHTNEKKNPLSANLTTQGVQGVTAQINNSFSQTLAEVAVSLAEDASTYLDDEATQATLDRLNNRLESLSAQLNAGADTVDSLSALIGSSIPLANGVNNLASSVQDSFEGAVGNSLGSGGGSVDPFSAISAGLGDSLDLAASNISNVESRLDDLLNSADSTAQSSAAAIEQLAAMLDEQIAGFQETRDEIVRIIDEAGIGDLVEGTVIEDFVADLDAAIARQQGLSDRLKTIAKDLRDGATGGSDTADTAREAVDQAAAAIKLAYENYSQNLQPQIDSLRRNLQSTSENAAVFRSHMETVKATLSETEGGLVAVMRRSQEALGETAESMRGGADRLDDVIDKIVKARDGDNFDQVAQALGTDPQGFARLIASPVAVERNAVFPVISFGVGMTPLFTAIALWVGALLTGVFIRVDISKNVGRRYLASTAAAAGKDTDIDDRDAAVDAGDANKSGSESESAQTELDATQASPGAVAKTALENGDETGDVDSGQSEEVAEQQESAEGEVSTEDAAPRGEAPAENKSQPKHSKQKPVFNGVQEYVGRFVMFWLIGMAQSTLLMGGLILFVEIEPVHPFLLIVVGWITSTVFMSIIYTLVFALSNAGKAVAVLLLVLQISAAGGAYPLELLPQWFQNISPWLPATYAINLMRAAISGIFEGDFLHNLLMISLFVLPNLLIGIVLRRTVSGKVEKINQDLERTKVM